MTLLIACSGDSTGSGGSSGSAGSGGNSGTLPTSDAYCSAVHTFETRCAAPYTDATCRSEYTCISSLARGDAMQGFVATCYGATTDCARSLDVCKAEASAKLPANPVFTAFKTACQARHDDCTGDGGPAFSDYICFSAAMMTEASIQKLADCVAKPCDEISLCIEALLTAAGCQ